jgi:cytochrome P450
MPNVTEGANRPSTASHGSMLATAEVEPWGYYEELRDLGDVVWDEEFGAWLVLSYDLVKEVARDADAQWQMPFEIDESRPAPFGMTHDEWRRYFGWGSTMFMAMVEGPIHDAQHRWMMRALSPRILKTWRETLFVPTADRLIDRFVERGHAELNAEFSDHLAPKVIASIMGLPYEDDAFIARLSSAVTRKVALKQHTSDPNPDPELVRAGIEANDELTELLLPEVRAARERDADDMLSMIWRDADAMFGTPDWTEIDIVGMAGGIWEGGSHSTRNSTSNGLWLTLGHPGLQEAVRTGGEEARRRLVEEALRLYGPVAYRPRVAREDVQLGSVLVRKGETVLTLMIAAGRDESHYSCPFSVDLERESPRDHLQFYFGKHACPGQALARAELEVALDRVFSRLPDVRFDPDAEPPHYEGLLARRYTPLHVTFTPGAKLGG